MATTTPTAPSSAKTLKDTVAKAQAVAAQAKAKGIDTSAIDSTIRKGTAMGHQSDAQGSKPFAGSSFEQDYLSNEPSAVPTNLPQETQTAAADQQTAQTQSAPAKTDSGTITDPVTGNKYAIGAGGTYQQIGDNNTDTTPAKDRYQVGHENAQASGKAAPTTSGAAATAMTGMLPPKTEETQQAPQVENMYATNKTLQQSMQEVQDFLSPTNTTKALEDSMKKVMSDQKEAAQLKFNLMDVNRVMAGSDQDIRDEVTKAGGFATESQVQGLTVARNKSLLQRASVINNQLQFMQDTINSDMTMVGFQKDMAQQQFAQRTFLLNYKQQNDQFIYKANQDAAQNQLAMLGADGLLAATGGDAVKISRTEKTLGLQPGQLAVGAKKATEDRALAVKEKQMSIAASGASIRASNASVAKTYTEIKKLNADIASGANKGDELKTSALTTAQQLLEQIKTGQGSSAIGGSILNRLGGIGDLISKGTPRAQFVTDYDNLKALLSLDNVKYLKGQGQVSDAERHLLEDAASKLNRNLSPADFRIQLQSIIDGLGGGGGGGGTTGTKVGGSQTVVYQGKTYSVDANGNMNPL